MSTWANLSTKERDEMQNCCLVVERLCRSVGPDCQVIFTAKGVNVAPLSWAGESSGPDLYTALCDALASDE